MAKTMKQAWLLGHGNNWEIREVPIPKPGPNQVCVKMLATSICNQTDGTALYAGHPVHDHQLMGMLPHDFRIYDGRTPDELSDIYPARPYPLDPYPSTMGHEGMGVIVEVGPHLDPVPNVLHSYDTEFKVGDRVSLIGTIGALGEYVLNTVDNIVKVADNVTNEEASLFEPSWVVFGVVRQCVEIMDTVVILGQGALGLLATQMCRLFGAKQIITTEPVAFKRELSKKFGADIVLDPNAVNVVHEIEKITDGKGVQCVIEAAGVKETTRMIPYIGGFGCKVGLMGVCFDPVLFDISYLHFKGMELYTMVHGNLAFGNPSRMLHKANELMASGRIDYKSLITHRYHTLDDMPKAFDEIKKGNIVKSVFLLNQ